MSDDEKNLAVKLRLDGYPVWYISEKIGYCQQTIRNYTRDTKRDYTWWTEEETQKLLELVGQGKTFRHIAAVLARSHASCHRRYIICSRNASVGR